MGFTLESAPQPSVLACPLSSSIAAAHRPTIATQSVSFRPRGSSPPRRFTPRSACQSIAPDYRQGFAASAPAFATEVTPTDASGCASPSQKCSRRIAHIAAGTTTRPGPPSNRTPRCPETMLIHTPPPKRCGCGAAKSARFAPTRERIQACGTRGCVRPESRSTHPTQAPGWFLGNTRF